MPSVGTQPLCRSCMAKAPIAGPSVVTTNPSPRNPLPSGPLAAAGTPPPVLALSGPQRLRLSWLALAAGALLGFLATGGALERSRSADEAVYLFLVGPLGMAYTGWALFWGAPASWHWFWNHRSIFAGLRKAKHLGPLYYLTCSLAWVLWGVVVFSVLGGGIYHFVRYRRSLP
jgi:hypothetical protein